MKIRLVFPKIILFLFLFTSIAQAQVGIGTTSPAGGSLLDISSADKGILIPRVDITDLSTAAPVTGDLTNSESLLVYNTNTTTGKGFYYWDGTQWVAVGGSAENIYTSDGSLPETRTVNLDENILRFDNGVGRYLNLQGASVSDNNDPFLFTTFNALRFDIDNAPVLSLDSDQNVGVGLSDANAKLHIFENTGTAASPSTGTLVLEHGNEGGASSIVFKSRSNNNSDYGYLNFSDDGSGNGSTGENALLEIGIQNDTPGAYQDDINIASTGSVGISNRTPNSSASLDLGANNRGLLLNRVSLNSITDNTTIQNPATGLFVYNTATAGSGTTRVQPGLYYWNGSIWSRIFKSGYSVQYKQNADARADNNTTVYVNIPGLTNISFTAPTTGKFQLLLNGYHSSGTPINSTFQANLQQNGSTVSGYYINEQQDGASQGSIRIQQNGTTIGEKYVTSVSKAFPGQSFYSLAQSLVIIVNVDLVAGQTYTFNVQGREWARYNADRGHFGRQTSGVYAGANGAANTQYADLTITLINEY